MSCRSEVAVLRLPFGFRRGGPARPLAGPSCPWVEGAAHLLGGAQQDKDRYWGRCFLSSDRYSGCWTNSGAIAAVEGS
jgi:hypothetical protein